MNRRWALLLCSFVVSISHAADWPQWLGPNRDGTIPAKIAPWKGDLESAWKVSVGEGNSSPIAADGKVFIHSKVKDKDIEMVQAFDVTNGKEVWQKTYEKTPFKPLFGEGPRATPVVDGKYLYTFGNTGMLACWEVANGNSVWKIDVLKDPKKDNLFFGISSSPLIVGDNVVVLAGSKGSPGIKAFNKTTGKEVWTAGDDANSYAAPVLINNEIIALTGAHLVSISPTGSINWKVPFKDALNESSTTPIKVNDQFIAASVTAGAIGVKIDAKDGKPTPTQAWANKAITCYFSTPVPISKDHLFVVTGVASLTNAEVKLHCVEVATGKIVWTQGKIGKYHAALLKTADGNILMHDDKGDLTLLAPNAKEFEVLAKSKGSSTTWAHPAIANGLIFLRDSKELIALKLPK